MHQYSLSDIKKSYYSKKKWEKQFPINYYLVRPLSFILTFIILKFTNSPLQVAWMGALIGWLGCLSFLGIGAAGWIIWVGFLLISIFSVFDAVDGNIARTTGDVTYYGKFVDSAIGETIESSYCFWLGLGLSGNILDVFYESSAFEYKCESIFLLYGSVIMSGRLFSGFIDLKYENLYNETSRDGESHSFDDKIQMPEIQMSRFNKNLFYQIFINLNLFNNQLLLLGISIWCDSVEWFMCFFSLYYFLRATVYFFYFVYRGRQVLM